MSVRRLRLAHTIIRHHAGSFRVNIYKTTCGVVTVSVMCMSPAIAIQELSLLGVRSMITTSGTLSPLSSFSSSLGFVSPIMLKNEHVVGSDRVLVRTMKQGVNGCVLNGTHANCNNHSYLFDMGLTMLKLMGVIPGGVIVFFPSTASMNIAMRFWETALDADNTGLTIWQSMHYEKVVVVEPPSTEGMAMVMNKFKDGVQSRGSVLFAVCRGNFSEGMDFPDDLCRAVFNVGVPYLPRRDTKVQLMMEYQNTRAREMCVSSSTAKDHGDKWYKRQAHLAVNQGCGRAVRHASDHGVVIFFDDRYSNNGTSGGLSEWLVSATSFFPHCFCFEPLIRQAEIKHPDSDTIIVGAGVDAIFRSI